MIASNTRLFVTFALTRPLAKAPTRQATGASVNDVFAPKDVGPWYDSYGAFGLLQTGSNYALSIGVSDFIRFQGARIEHGDPRKKGKRCQPAAHPNR